MNGWIEVSGLCHIRAQDSAAKMVSESCNVYHFSYILFEL